MEHVSCPSKKILIKPRFIRTSSRWWVLLWKNYGWFLIECQFSIFHQISQVRTCNNFQFLNHHGASELSIKKAPNQARIYQDLMKMVSITLERLWMASNRFSIFRQISQVRTCNNFQFFNHHGASELSITKAPYQANIYQDLIKMMSVTLERLWLVWDRIIDFRFFVKFHRSGPAIIFNSWTIMEHVSCPSKKILIKPRFIRTSSRWWVLLWKVCCWFLIELLIFDFSWNFTGPDMQ